MSALPNTSIVDVVATIDVERRPRDQLGTVEGQERGRPTHVIDADKAASRRLASICPGAITSSGMKISLSSSCANGSTCFFRLVV